MKAIMSIEIRKDEKKEIKSVLIGDKSHIDLAIRASIGAKFKVNGVTSTIELLEQIIKKLKESKDEQKDK
jgi:hypothetical protein